MIHPRPRDERTDVAVSGRVLRQQHEMCEYAAPGRVARTLRLLDRQLGADDPVECVLRRRAREPHDAAEFVVIGDRHRVQPELAGAFHEPLRMRRAVEQ
jgi:hypothetical protein